jgi:uncharacterized secreted protein with C-terminal beta-propeller domain
MMRLLSPLGVVGLSLWLGGCRAEPPAKVDDPAPKGDPAAPSSARLRRFESCDDLKERVTDAWVEEIVRWRYSSWGWYDTAAGAEDGASSTDAPASGGDRSGPTDYSETNTQVEGVDEPDMVKTDGNYLYVLQQNTSELTIVKSWPAAEAAVESTLQLEGWASSMFLHGDTLVVFSQVYEPYTDGTADTSWRYGAAQRISVIDVSDRSAPVVRREIDLEGYMTAGRKIGGDVYVVLDAWMSYPSEVWELAQDETLGLPAANWEGTEEEQEAIRAEARALLAEPVGALVDSMDEADLLPRVWDHLPGEEVDGAPLLACEDLYAPEALSQLGTLSVVHLDLEAAPTEPVSASGVYANGWTVYASQESLYVAQTSWSWWWGWGGQEDLQTHIHRFALAGADTVYTGSGAVDGWILNQFAMDDDGTNLRVATTDWNSWGGAVGVAEGDVATSGEATEAAPPAEGDTSTGTAADTSEPAQPGNNVWVLDTEGETLDVVGSVRGIAPGEQIYAVRFLGDTGYVVTFRQTDPLFTLDLSDATNPQVVGELHVPGYSSYLHPVEGGYLLAVGMDGEEDGTINGFAVSLFDVRDAANPTRLDQLTVQSDSWSWSESLWDHHAFTFHNDVLSVPLYTYDWDEVTGAWDGFSGMLVVSVDTADGLAELGRVDHSDMVAVSECPWDYGYVEDGTTTETSDPADDSGGSTGGSDGSADSGGASTPGSEGSADGTSDSSDAASGEPGACPDSYWYAPMRRSVVIEDYLYSISDYGVKISEHAAPANQVGTVLFRPLP